MVHFDRIEFTVHAKERMVERSITAEAVVDVLLAPDVTCIDGGEHVAERMGPEQKPTRVVFTIHEDQPSGLTIRVITVYRIRKLKV